MKGATSNDGRMTGNVQTVGRYNDSKQPPKDPAGGGHEEISNVVAQHGPADKQIISKTSGGIHSETHHGGGHTHHSDHASLDEAHQHGKVAMEDAEHNTMGEDSMHNAGLRSAAEKPGKHSSFMD